MPLEINVITDRAGGGSVPDNISQYKAEYQSLWNESEERRNADVTLTVLLL